MDIKNFLDKIFSHRERIALVHNDVKYRYVDLLNKYSEINGRLNEAEICLGNSVSLEANYSFNSIAAFLSLLSRSNIVTPILDSLPAAERNYYKETSQAQFNVICRDHLEWERLSGEITNRLLLQLKSQHHPGLIIYTSGTTDAPKAALHDATIFLNRFEKKRQPFITLSSLIFDHVGGIDVLFTVLSSGGTLVVPQDLSPDSLCATIEKHQVELFPASASILSLIAISEAYRNYDLTSVKVIAYGSEIMPDSLLKKLPQIFPNARLKQTYGTTETGTFSTKSQSSGSLYLRFDPSEQEIKVVDGLLWIRSPRSMLGYLNAPNPLEDGWMNTGDQVSIEGDWVRILGRSNGVINVGGLKVFPSEVENVISELPFVREVIAYGEHNEILGNIVVAKIIPAVSDFDENRIKSEIRTHCKNKLSHYKVPQKIIISHESIHGYRLKKVRR